MAPIFDRLPGIEVPVGSIATSLAAMWQDTASRGQSAPAADTAKATQINLVLHLGFHTTEDDAEVQFRTAVRFAQRYPSRVLILCPLRMDATATEMRAKIYGECFLGKNPEDARCVEFVVLSYPFSARDYLENQASICLSADLPVYYWAHRFSDISRLADYQYLLNRARRVIIDSAIAPDGALTYPWPKPQTLRDLAYCRLLPIRQTMGQVLASHPPQQLVEGLRKVTVEYSEGFAAEGRLLLAWLKQRLEACGAGVREQVEFNAAGLVPPAPLRLAVHFGYAQEAKYFHWSGDFASRQAQFEAALGSGATKLPAMAALLSPEASLSEAMFF